MCFRQSVSQSARIPGCLVPRPYSMLGNCHEAKLKSGATTCTQKQEKEATKRQKGVSGSPFFKLRPYVEVQACAIEWHDRPYSLIFRVWSDRIGDNMVCATTRHKHIQIRLHTSPSLFMTSGNKRCCLLVCLYKSRNYSVTAVVS